MPLTRTPHWDTREFHDWLLGNAETPYRYGTFDCCLMPADAIRSFTGVDLAADVRGRYTDVPSSLAVIAEVCGGNSTEDAVAWCAVKHELKEWPGPLFAQRGDLVLLEDAGRLIGGVVHLNGRHCVAAGVTGLKVLPLGAIRRAWKI